ncbi:hypothetical protein [Pseudonocardia sp.]|uniref:hypothetical protein n=1 Tax=Pseudonocardia sp. TaxID=60912 RepID=UPI003D11999E
MTTPEPGAVAGQLDEAAGLLGVYAGELRAALTSVRALVADVAADWSDPTGAAWVDRADLLRRDLDRHADDAADLAARASRAAADVSRPATDPAAGPMPAGPVPSGSMPAGSVPSGSVPAGPVLAGTETRRVLPGTGMRIATLPGA